jgi:hypothetical protein
MYTNTYRALTPKRDPGTVGMLHKEFKEVRRHTSVLMSLEAFGLCREINRTNMKIDGMNIPREFLASGMRR